MQNQAKNTREQDLERILSELETMPEEQVKQTLALTMANRETADGKR